MLRKFYPLLLGSFIADIVSSCWQVNVASFSNMNKISDYMTNRDEITMRFGVGRIIAYQYSNFFKENQVIEVPEGKITFPCFEEEAFYFHVMEHDEYQDDKAIQVSVGCENLQEGFNDIQLHLSEKSDLLSKVYDTVKDTGATEFRFFDDALINQSVYSIQLEVLGKCEQPVSLMDEDMELSGYLQYRSVKETEMNERIQQEEFSGKPGIIMGAGVMKDQSSRISVDTFATEASFTEALEGEPFEDHKQWFAEQEDGLQDQRTSKWVIIGLVVLVIVVLLALATPIICCCWCCKKRNEVKDQVTFLDGSNNAGIQ